MTSDLTSDVLVVGAGVAGGITALQLADRGVSVVLVSKGMDPSQSATFHAQGGIAYEGINDSQELFEKDILGAGGGHCHPKAVSILVAEGAKRIRQMLIDRLQISFDRTETGEFSLGLEGGHSIPRILHCADATGRAIATALFRELSKHPQIKMVQGLTAVDLLTPAHHANNRHQIYEPLSCAGVYFFDPAKNRVIRCLAKKTVLATGGLGAIYCRTTNPSGSLGDGLAMAYRAGAHAINNEFIQFHPTTFYHPSAPPFLITEAVRGAGARLAHEDGKPFMEKYDPAWKDLAPRDVVARGIYQEMLEQKTSQVYLDLRSRISKQKIMDSFPNIYRQCLNYKVDLTEDLVPVTPAAHYACGGIWADEWGKTTLQNLHAVGETACTGVHGANRLASTSLLEGLVWGCRVAESIERDLPESVLSNAEDYPEWHDAGTAFPDSALVLQDMSTIRHVMWNYVGLVRSRDRLERALRELRHLQIEIERFYRSSRLSVELIELRNAIQTALIVATAGWKNRKSLGCHFRQD